MRNNFDGQISGINEKISTKKKSVTKTKNIERLRWGSNPQPQVYETCTLPTELDKLCGYIFELGAIDLGAELGGTSAPRRRGWDSAARTSAP
jgi:hypothetical protein